MQDDAMKDRDDLDILLDAALATYADPGTPPGLTSRIIASARSIDSRRRPVKWLPWAVPAIAALLLVVTFFTHRGTVRHEKSPVATGSPSPRPSIASPAPVVASVITPPPPRSVLPRPATVVREATPKQPQLPRLEVFPTPAPLSPEEQALADLVNRDPRIVTRQIAQSAITPQPQPVERIHIAAIHIPPLNPPDNGGN